MLCLTACADKVCPVNEALTDHDVTRPIPPEIATCEDEPQEPTFTSDQSVREKEIQKADWFANAIEAGRDCRDKLAAAVRIENAPTLQTTTNGGDPSRAP
jgi:hypothetical protein